MYTFHVYMTPAAVRRTSAEVSHPPNLRKTFESNNLGGRVKSKPSPINQNIPQGRGLPGGACGGVGPSVGPRRGGAGPEIGAGIGAGRRARANMYEYEVSCICPILAI